MRIPFSIGISSLKFSSCVPAETSYIEIGKRIIFQIKITVKRQTGFSDIQSK